MASQIPLMEPKRGPATPAPTATPSMKDRVSQLSSMVKTAQPQKVGGVAAKLGKPQVNVQPKPRVAVPVGKPQVNVQPRMAKGGSVAKKAKK